MSSVDLQCSREKAREAIFYSYTKHINGFAANLEPRHAAEIASEPLTADRTLSHDDLSNMHDLYIFSTLKCISGYPGVVSVFPNRGRKLHTTRTWEFMGLERAGDVPQWSAWEKARYGEDTIIGNLDSGTHLIVIDHSHHHRSPNSLTSRRTARQRRLAGVQELRRRRNGAHPRRLEGHLPERPRQDVPMQQVWCAVRPQTSPSFYLFFCVIETLTNTSTYC